MEVQRLLYFIGYDQYNEVKFYGFSDTTDSGVWQFINDGTWNQTRFFIQDANNSSSRLTLHVKGNNGATEILAATSAGNVVLERKAQMLFYMFIQQVMEK